MNKVYTIFAELLKLCPRYQFERATERYKGDHLLARCRDLTPKHRFRFKNPLYTIDATTIDLCLRLFPWAKFRKTKGAIKMHSCMTTRGRCRPF